MLFLIYSMCIINVCLHAEDAAFIKFKLDKSVIQADSVTVITDFNKNINKITKIRDAIVSFQAIVSPDKMRNSKNDTIIILLDKHLKRNVYINLQQQFGIRRIEMDNDGYPRTISFKTAYPRAMTENEKEESSKTKGFAPSYCTISKDTAIARAYKLLAAIYGNAEAETFDSVTVKDLGNRTDYYISFSIKRTGDIVDFRKANIIINANTGQIMDYYFHGPVKRPSYLDFNYVPKVSKTEVLTIYEDKKIRLNADIDIQEVYLYWNEIKNVNRWEWRIYGHRKDKILGTSAMMFFDSETGEVLFERMY